jgi:RNA polymerase sigma-70 factor (ECF subfamily)
VTDFDNLNKAAGGDPGAIEQICLATWEPLYHFIYYKVQNREEAEDITQETYVKTLTYLQKQNTPPDNFLAYMKTVAFNVLRDRWRQKKRRGITVNIDEINLEDMAGQDPHKAVAQRLQLENAMKKLSAEQRAIIDLRIIKGHSVAETAKIVGKTEAAVRSSQYRALQALSRLLDGND